MKHKKSPIKRFLKTVSLLITVAYVLRYSPLLSDLERVGRFVVQVGNEAKYRFIRAKKGVLVAEIVCWGKERLK